MSRYTRAFLPLLLFVIGLLPRFLALDAFLTTDECRWIGRSREFLVGVLSKDWAATLQTEHPGATTMWTGSIGILYKYWTRSPSAPDDLLDFVQQVPSYPCETSYIAPMRFPTVLLMSLFIVAFYMLLSRLFDDWRVGAGAALLLALNPFHIALSRVLHHDALTTAFMTITVLTLTGYWLKAWSRRWLLLSAITAGLGFLSKSPAIFLMPFCALIGLIWAVRRWRRGAWQGWSDVRRLVADGLLWGTVAWLTVLLLWPAMWVIPHKALMFVFRKGGSYAIRGHYWGNFFLGQITKNPGPLFYPLNWLLRTTPLGLLGLLIWGIVYLQDVLSHKQPGKVLSARALSGTLLLYAGLFVVFMTLGAKKQDRYILPIYPALDALAALGLVWIFSLEFRVANLKPWPAERLAWPLVVAGLLLQVGLASSCHPYYFTYYNPLLGGATMAARLTTVGWGEGLDQAAAYLNDLPEAEKLNVASWYPHSFAPFFRGKVFGSEAEVPPLYRAGEALSSDYTVVYRNQIQRRLPTTELIRYLLMHHAPVFTVTLQGLEYVYVYDIPLARHTDWQTSRLLGKAIFFGVSDVEAESETGTEAEGSALSLRLYWQNDGLAANERWWVALQPIDGTIRPWQGCDLRPSFADERLMIGALLESECRLVNERLSPGTYYLHVGVGTRTNGIMIIPLPRGELAISVQDDGRPRLVSHR